MTAAVNPPATDLPTTRQQVLSTYVRSKVTSLQGGYLANTSTAVAALARLRRAVGTAPGADPAVWSIVFEMLPPSLVGHTDEPSRAERAVHAAITLYAVHQQGQRDRPMHRSGPSIGRAAGELARSRAEAGAIDPGVLRRFQALGTSSSLSETLYHARSLITQLRSAGIAADYGRLAVDLDRLQQPDAADGVRLTWGREFYRTRSADSDNDTPTTEGDLT